MNEWQRLSARPQPQWKWCNAFTAFYRNSQSALPRPFQRSRVKRHVAALPHSLPMHGSFKNSNTAWNSVSRSTLSAADKQMMFNELWS